MLSHCVWWEQVQFEDYLYFLKLVSLSHQEKNFKDSDQVLLNLCFGHCVILQRLWPDHIFMKMAKITLVQTGIYSKFKLLLQSQNQLLMEKDK